MREDEVIIRLHDALTKCGVPKDAIVIGRSIRYHNRSVAYPDISIVGADHETVVALFEIKVNGESKDTKYGRALRSYQEILERCPCYVVSLESNGIMLAARLSLTRKEGRNGWVDVDDADKFEKLVGRYEVESAAAIESSRSETATAKQEELDPAKWVVGGVGLALTIVCAWMEWFHHEFSWKVYSVFFATLVLFAVGSGYSIYLRSGDHVIRIGRDQPKQSREDAQGNEPRIDTDELREGVRLREIGGLIEAALPRGDGAAGVRVLPRLSVLLRLEFAKFLVEFRENNFVRDAFAFGEFAAGDGDVFSELRIYEVVLHARIRKDRSASLCGSIQGRAFLP